MIIITRLLDMFERLIKVIGYMIVGALTLDYMQEHPERVAQFKTEVLPTLFRWQDTVENFFIDRTQESWSDMINLGTVLFFLVVLLALVVYISHSNKKYQEYRELERQEFERYLQQMQQQPCCKCWCHNGPTGAMPLPRTTKH